jgi:DNA-binding NarL/FixJ family response regulator
MNRDELAEDTLQQYCLPLIRRVHEEPPGQWGPWLASLPEDRVRVMAVLLAALVPVDEPVSALTAWTRLGVPQPVETETVAATLATWLVNGGAPPVQSAVEIDGNLIDLVAVRQALQGQEAHLTSAERRLAILAGTRAGLSSADIAKRIRITQRSVVRTRSALQCGRREVAA